MNNIIEEIYNEVKSRCMKSTNVYGVGAWTNHIEVVYKIAIKICEEYGADYNVVALAALLHDVASVTDEKYYEEHHIIGARIAGELLNKYDLPDDMIKHIQNCILNHRGSRLATKVTPEEICIADADAMTHFFEVPSLLNMVYVEKKLSIEDGAQFVLNKLRRSYNKLSDKGKEIVTPQYEAAKVLLKRNF